jgi:uncharacterized protein (DUF1697 family)
MAIVTDKFGFTPKILVLNKEDFLAAIEQNPFPKAINEPKSLHLNFMTQIPVNPDYEKMELLRKNNEQFKIIDKVLYFHAPDGIGRSKLAANMEKLLDVSFTGRNWRTVTKIAEML